MKPDINYADFIPVRKFHVNRYNLLFLKQNIVKIFSYFFKKFYKLSNYYNIYFQSIKTQT